MEIMTDAVLPRLTTRCYLQEYLNRDEAEKEIIRILINVRHYIKLHPPRINEDG